MYSKLTQKYIPFKHQFLFFSVEFIAYVIVLLCFLFLKTFSLILLRNLIVTFLNI